jgi:hypothetical protein
LLNAAVTVDPTNAPAWQDLGEEYAGAGQYALAVHALQSSNRPTASGSLQQRDIQLAVKPSAILGRFRRALPE